jgi:hypothetical protein
MNDFYVTISVKIKKGVLAENIDAADEATLELRRSIRKALNSVSIMFLYYDGRCEIVSASGSTSKSFGI